MKNLLLLACLFTLMQAGTPASATPSPLPSTVQANEALTLDQFREQLEATIVRFDIIATSASPQYIWQLSSATLTGIDGVEAGPTANADSRSYDLSGRPVASTLKKGIYIRQGRKIVVK